MVNNSTTLLPSEQENNSNNHINGVVKGDYQAIPTNGTTITDSLSTHNGDVEEERKKKKRPWFKKNALHFAIRMAILLFFSGIFVIVKDPKNGTSFVPQSKWILITVLFVSWFPSLDAASVVKKSMDRLAGTFIGAFLGLLCGFLSLLFPTETGKLCFLQFTTAAIPLGVILAFTHITTPYNKKSTLLQEHNYAAILCLLTFFLAMFPFSTTTGSDSNSPWHYAIWRIINVMLGCIISALGSIIILPKSTEEIIQQKIEAQIQLAGESSEAVMHAAVDTFEGTMQPLKLAEEMLETLKERKSRLRKSVSRSQSQYVRKEVIDEEGDVAIEKYESAIQDWKATKSLLQMRKFDPFHNLPCMGGVSGGAYSTSSSHSSYHHTDEDDEEEQNDLFSQQPSYASTARNTTTKEDFAQYVAKTVARAHRVQTTVLLLDGIVRNEPRHEFTSDHLSLFADVGSLIHKMFAIPYDEGSCSGAAEELFRKLPQIRHFIIQNSSTVADSPGTELPAREKMMKSNVVLGSFRKRMNFGSDNDGKSFPKFVRGSNVCANLFLQLVEHLMVRSLKLYQSWQKVQEYYDMQEGKDYRHKQKQIFFSQR